MAKEEMLIQKVEAKGYNVVQINNKRIKITYKDQRQEQQWSASFRKKQQVAYIEDIPKEQTLFQFCIDYWLTVCPKMGCEALYIRKTDAKDSQSYVESKGFLPWEKEPGVQVGYLYPIKKDYIQHIQNLNNQMNQVFAETQTMHPTFDFRRIRNGRMPAIQSFRFFHYGYHGKIVNEYKGKGMISMTLSRNGTADEDEYYLVNADNIHGVLTRHLDKVFKANRLPYAMGMRKKHHLHSYMKKNHVPLEQQKGLEQLLSQKMSAAQLEMKLAINKDKAGTILYECGFSHDKKQLFVFLIANYIFMKSDASQQWLCYQKESVHAIHADVKKEIGKLVKAVLIEGSGVLKVVDKESKTLASYRLLMDAPEASIRYKGNWQVNVAGAEKGVSNLKEAEQVFCQEVSAVLFNEQKKHLEKLIDQLE